MTTLHVVHEDDWLTKTLAQLYAANDAAKAISRRGKSAMLRDEYRDAHKVINALLLELETLT